MQIVNGQASRTTSWRLLIKAKQSGTFTIPAFEIEGVSSTAIEVEVVEGSAQTQTANDAQLFLQSSLDSTQLYVQQLAYLEVKIFFQGVGNNRHHSFFSGATFAHHEKTLGHFPTR